MTWILTNDDGIDAPGMAALAESIHMLTPTVPLITIAPRDHQSGCGHQVTTVTPITVEERAKDSYAVAGTPADCIRLGLSHLSPQMEWVLSGINAGGNLGVDIYMSGTVAAVREAAFHGIPGIAISHYRQGLRPYNWPAASRWAAQVIAKLMTLPHQPGCFWNVNLPHLLPDAADPEIIFCQPCSQPLPVVYQQGDEGFIYAGKYSERARDKGTDVEICFAGAIAVTQIFV